MRESRLAEKLRLSAKRKARTVDALEFCLSLHAMEAADYEPELPWESKSPSERQLKALARAGFDTGNIIYRGHASKILDLLLNYYHRVPESKKGPKLAEKYRKAA